MSTRPRSGPAPARLVAVALVAVAMLSGACGGGKGSSTAKRPTTSARLQIVSPTPNEVTGPDLTIQLALTGGEIVQASTGPLRPDQGHIHVSVDGKLISMAYGTSQDLHGLTPGPHTMSAEYVATDHAPFANRVVAAVLFQVQAP